MKPLPRRLPSFIEEAPFLFPKMQTLILYFLGVRASLLRGQNTKVYLTSWKKYSLSFSGRGNLIPLPLLDDGTYQTVRALSESLVRLMKLCPLI